MCSYTTLCNLSLIACFLALMFHKVVWQHVQDVVGFLINQFTANLPGFPLRKNENRLKFDRIIATSLWPHFLALSVEILSKTEQLLYKEAPICVC